MAKKKRAKSAGHFQTTPWTSVEADSLFVSNKSFRGLAMKAARNLARIATKANLSVREPDLDTAKALVQDAVRLSTQIGKETSQTDKENKARYPHPAMILTFWADFNPRGGGDTELMRTTRGYIGSYIVGFKGSAMEASVWSAFSQATTSSSPASTFYATNRIHKLAVKKSGVFNGFRLAEITIRIPVGQRLKMVGNKAVSAPTGFQTKTISMFDPEIREKLGDVWIAMTSDKRSMFIASSKTSGVKLSDLIARGRTSSGRFPGRFSTLHPAAAKIKGQVPESIRRALARAKVDKSGDKSVIDLSA